jgi:hypothetical protein
VVSTPLSCKKLLTDSTTESMFGLFATSFMPCATLFGKDLTCALTLALECFEFPLFGNAHFWSLFGSGLPQQYGTGWAGTDLCPSKYTTLPAYHRTLQHYAEMMTGSRCSPSAPDENFFLFLLQISDIEIQRDPLRTPT